MTIGLDRSIRLLEIAKNAGGIPREVVHGDALGRCWRNGIFDYAISIATIHHLSSPERRMQSVQRLLEAVSPYHGRVLIYVWAIEQDDKSKRVIPSESTSISGQDVLVPWVLSASAMGATQGSDRVLERYYHMFAKGELTGLVTQAAQKMGLAVGTQAAGHEETEGVEIVQDGYERSNYFVVLRRWRTEMS
ncbi:hypothetical protein CYLTODRAFT_421459 [Cylindrobasidium torrendii FP15055 ss-10]|uniref:Methyltransferase type 11 domain-containing protein n=1 Tax=Cylindrobasidium torrendii FP15055 ss-10 TaxID=1314674 RepID=A0A0D7BEP0_9AGAR|nr:hypothetical protein CYLTODRAFT_421459 [Cylindrobasidium torrendii FP15055 ss-10]